jgi:ATP-dependent Clp protease ATP-binding subunit ClpB
MSTVRGYFPPEFLNRIDETVLFNKLRREDMKEIVLNQVCVSACRLSVVLLSLCLLSVVSSGNRPEFFGGC